MRQQLGSLLGLSSQQGVLLFLAPVELGEWGNKEGIGKGVGNRE
jgi:hypothetical protein